MFHYHNNEGYVEKVKIADLIQQHNTPCYIYSRQQIEANWSAFDTAFGAHPHQICYAVKANPNLGILSVLAKLGSGFDIVSRGELERVITAGGDPQKVVYSGVCKQVDEIDYAIEMGIHCFNVESEMEIDLIEQIAAAKNKIVNIALRVNPDIDANTHPYIATGMKENKFGIEFDRVIPLCEKIANLHHIKLIGLACHIGSQLLTLEPYRLAVKKVMRLYKTLQENGYALQQVNLGGGLGVPYADEVAPSRTDYVDLLVREVNDPTIPIFIEPGRSIIAEAGRLITTVTYLKKTSHKHFAIVDAGMNDLLRPALYEAFHAITPVKQATKGVTDIYDVVGPVCESADFLGKNRELTLSVNDLLAIHTAGAYGSSMSSNYNSRPRPVELLIDQSEVYIIRQREKISDLFSLEQTI